MPYGQSVLSLPDHNRKSLKSDIHQHSHVALIGMLLFRLLYIRNMELRVYVANMVSCIDLNVTLSIRTLDIHKITHPLHHHHHITIITTVVTTVTESFTAFTNSKESPNSY